MNYYDYYGFLRMIRDFEGLLGIIMYYLGFVWVTKDYDGLLRAVMDYY